MNKSDLKKLADLRNKMGPIYNYVSLMEAYRDVYKSEMKTMIADQMGRTECSVLESMKQVKSILDSFG